MLNHGMILNHIDDIFGQDMHAKRVLSLANATLGVIGSGSLAIHAIGNGLSLANGLERKHAVKQVDRLLTNTKLNVWSLFDDWVPYVVGERTEIVVSMDWTEFDADDHSTWSSACKPATDATPRCCGRRATNPCSRGNAMPTRRSCWLSSS